MTKRYLSIWFRYLKTDWYTIRRPELRDVPFVLSGPDHGRMVVKTACRLAEAQDIHRGSTIADARAIVPGLLVIDDRPDLHTKLLRGIAEWCIGYTPDVAIDEPDGLLLDITGCTHLWGGEQAYLTSILTRLRQFGYWVRAAIADSIGAAWAVAHFGKESVIIVAPGQQQAALRDLPPAALRIDTAAVERLHKLGLKQINQFIRMPRATLQKRFGPGFIHRLQQALGVLPEKMESIQLIEMHQERLPCLSPVVTARGIEMALRQLLETLCLRLQKEEKGIRTACMKGFRVDGKMESITIGTHRPTHNVAHLFKLFELQIATIEPALGIELFLLEAIRVEALSPAQEALWKQDVGLQDTQITELLDRITGKIGNAHIHRYLPDEHYLPERSFKRAATLLEKATTNWRVARPRPLHLMSIPQPIEVTAPIPDYPPMLFRYKGQLHKVCKADGPERMEQEWWKQRGEHRDYFAVEDELGRRYWVFRLGHYGQDCSVQWFIHGFFA